MTSEIGSRCDVCGGSLHKNGRGVFMSCEACEYAAEHMNPRAMEWVQAVAKKAAADALEDMRTEMRRGYDP